MYYSIQDFIENGIADLEECEKNLMKNPLNANSGSSDHAFR